MWLEGQRARAVSPAIIYLYAYFYFYPLSLARLVGRATRWDTPARDHSPHQKRVKHTHYNL